MDDVMVIETVEQNSTAIAPVQPTDISGYQNAIMADVSEQGYYSTFKVETMADKKKLYRAKSDAKMLRDFMGVAIEVADFILAPQTINDADTGAKTVVAAYIVATDGVTYQSASTGVVKSVCTILSDFGNPSTWDEPLFVECKETYTAQGFRYKFLTVVE